MFDVSSVAIHSATAAAAEGVSALLVYPHLPKSNIFPIRSERLCVYSSPLLTLPSSELWRSADLKANNRPMLCLSLLPPSNPHPAVPPLPPFYLGQSLM